MNMNLMERLRFKDLSKRVFGYTKVTVEQPLIENGFVKTDKKEMLRPIVSSEIMSQYHFRPVEGILSVRTPHLPDAWMERKKDKVGYEINFTKYFYEYKPRAVEDILSEASLRKKRSKRPNEIFNISERN